MYQMEWGAAYGVGEGCGLTYWGSVGWEKQWDSLLVGAVG